MNNCVLCPRRCGIDRAARVGFCGAPEGAVVSRAAPHFWEEPCISGKNGSGTVFFSGCTLRCVFCQNRDISRKCVGKRLSGQELRRVFLGLCEKGVHNINLVTPSHFAPTIIAALEGGLPVPVVFNSGGYESVETLKMFENKVQIYLPDFKYSLSASAEKYSAAKDYPEVAKAAILEMYRQTGPCRFDRDGMLVSGVVIRHLVLPGNLKNTFGVIDWVRDTFQNSEVLFSLMSQYTPPKVEIPFEELKRPLSKHEYDRACEYLFDSGIENGFVQERSSADECYIPDFDLSEI